MPQHAFICDAIRTPFGRYSGALSSVRADDLGAVPLKALIARNPKVDWHAVGDVLFGCSQPGRQGQAQPRAYVCAAGRSAAERVWRDDQPSLRFRARCDGHGCARDPRR